MDELDPVDPRGRPPVGWIVPLHAASHEDPSSVGIKARTLGRLAQAGFAVPEGLVLTTAVSACVLESSGLGPDPVPTELAAAPLPDEVEALLSHVAGFFGQATVAVRSSAVFEDLVDASFAGQYLTVLTVRGRDALRDAVRRCWASAYGEPARSYLRSVGTTVGAPMALLVQRQVDADVAGVAFSADPVSGARDHVRVSAVRGLGDSLVNGKQLPDEWVVTGTSATAVRVTQQALAEPQARVVAGLARRVEAELGGAQDVEWAMADGKLLVLQARPVTALPQPPTPDLQSGTWVKDPDRYPEPMTALGASLAAPVVSQELSTMFATYGGLLDRFEMRSVGGEIYTRAVPHGGGGPPPPWWALAVLARVAPPLRRRMRAARRTTGPEALAGLIESWHSTWQPGIHEAVETLRDVELRALDDRELDAHLGRVVDLTVHALHVHFQLIPAYAVPLYDLVEACRHLLGWVPADALGLLTGASTSSTLPSRDLAALAGRIVQNPAAVEVVDVVDRSGSDVASRLTEVDPELGTAFDGWCARYAFRCVNNDPGSPVLAERPWVVAQLLRDAVRISADGARDLARATADEREATTARARAGLATRSPSDRDRFEHALAAASRSYPLREDTVFWGISLPAGLVRLAAMEAGRRLVAASVLARPEDAVDLPVDSLRSALTGPVPDGLRATAARNRSERAWVSQHPGPPHYGPTPFPPPDLRGLPKAARRLNAALLLPQRTGETPQSSMGSAGTQVTGSAGSPGRYTGPVRLVRGEADFGRVRAGEVLVCPTTDPTWSVLFATAGALVTDGGGLLSHAAIIAREHAIPAVVGAGVATQVLHDGDIVTVDGGRGLIDVQRQATASSRTVISSEMP